MYCGFTGKRLHQRSHHHSRAKTMTHKVHFERLRVLPSFCASNTIAYRVEEGEDQSAVTLVGCALVAMQVYWNTL